VPDFSLRYGEQTPEAAAIRLAGSQCGRLSVTQLAELGVTKQMIWRRLQAGRWRREHRGVILVGHETADHRGRCWAAQLAYGPDAVVSHQSAGALWEIVGHDRPVHLTLPHRRRSRDGITSHESRSLADDDVRIHYGLRVTNPLRTLVDLADVLTLHELERALSEAHRLGYVERHSLTAPRTPGRKGLVAVLRRGARMTRSQIERTLLDAIRATADIPLPRTNHRIGDFEADLYWPEYGLVVEIDVYATHGDRLSFERDRRKQTAFALLGLTTLRITEATLPTAIPSIRRWISDHGGRLYGQ
jgi:very-short-patch-repair endonuclease